VTCKRVWIGVRMLDWIQAAMMRSTGVQRSSCRRWWWSQWCSIINTQHPSNGDDGVPPSSPIVVVVLWHIIRDNTDYILPMQWALLPKSNYQLEIRQQIGSSSFKFHSSTTLRRHRSRLQDKQRLTSHPLCLFLGPVDDMVVLPDCRLDLQG
jgi:hypothetical protein